MVDLLPKKVDAMQETLDSLSRTEGFEGFAKLPYHPKNTPPQTVPGSIPRIPRNHHDNPQRTPPEQQERLLKHPPAHPNTPPHKEMPPLH